MSTYIYTYTYTCIQIYIHTHTHTHTHTHIGGRVGLVVCKMEHSYSYSYPLHRKEICSHVQSVQTDSGTHRFTESNPVGRAVDHSLPFSAEVKEEWS
jgi:hypothetical protein